MVLFVVFLMESHIWETSCYWDMGRNAFSQSDGRTLKSTISLEQIDKVAWFFACPFGDQSGYSNLKLTVSQEWTSWVNWFIPCWYKFRKAESCFNDSLVGFKNRHCLLVDEILKSANLRMNFCWYFASW